MDKSISKFVHKRRTTEGRTEIVLRSQCVLLTFFIQRLKHVILNTIRNWYLYLTSVAREAMPTYFEDLLLFSYNTHKIWKEFDAEHLFQKNFFQIDSWRVIGEGNGFDPLLFIQVRYGVTYPWAYRTSNVHTRIIRSMKATYSRKRSIWYFTFLW